MHDLVKQSALPKLSKLSIHKLRSIQNPSRASMVKPAMPFLIITVILSDIHEHHCEAWLMLEIRVELLAAIRLGAVIKNSIIRHQ
jgi:hypothetical protein